MKFNRLTETALTFIFIFLITHPAMSEMIYFYHTDPAGTPMAMTNSIGTVVWKADYKPFGEEYSTTGAAVNGKRFVGKEKDEETGLSYFGARYEDAKAGRFTAVDPIVAVDPGASKTNEKLLLNPQRLNAYSYGLNNPYRYVDPDGRDIAVIIGFPQGKNRFGHVAAAVTGYGVFSSGTKEELGSSFTNYIVNQTEYRDSTVFILPASKEQDSAFVSAFKDAAVKGHSASMNNCADITGAALQAAGLVGSNAMLKLPGMLNSYMNLRANEGRVSTVVEITQGNKKWGELGPLFRQFNPNPSKATGEW